jgi:hypothetical protein
MKENKEKEDCFDLIRNVVKELGKLEDHVEDTSELRRLHASLILGLCSNDKLANTKEEFLEGFNSYDSPFPRLGRLFK